MGRRSAGLMAATLALVLFACNPPAGTGPDEGSHPASKMEIIPVVIATKTGSHTIRAELADTPERQARGLEGRGELRPDEAMLFPNDKPTAQVFWTKDTQFPVDIVFVGLDGRVTNIVAMAEPDSDTQLFSVGSTSGTLEMRGGRAAQLGIEPGDEVTW